MLGSSGLSITPLTDALKFTKLHQEGATAGGLWLLSGDYGATFVPFRRGKVPRLNLYGGTLVIVDDSDSHNLHNSNTIADLEAKNFFQSGGIYLLNTANTAIHELLHAMVFWTGCFRGDDEGLVQSLADDLGLRVAAYMFLLNGQVSEATTAYNTLVSTVNQELQTNPSWAKCYQLLNVVAPLPQLTPEIQNLSGNTGKSSSHVMAVAGSNIFVVWEDETPGNLEIFYRRSSDGGLNWNPPLTQPALNLSNDAGSSMTPQIAADGNTVFVVWIDYTGDTSNPSTLVSRRSTDGGVTFDPVQVLRNSGSPLYPQVALSGSIVHLVWIETSSVWPGPQTLFYQRSIDGGITFEPVVNLSGTQQLQTGLLRLVVDGDNVAVVWDNRYDYTITFRGSTDGGATFGPAINLSASLAQPAGEYPEVAVKGSNVYVVWQEIPAPEPYNILYRRSTDGGATFEPIQSLSETGQAAPIAKISVSGSNVYVVWPDGAAGEIMFRRSSDSGASFEPAQNISATQGSISNQSELVATGSVVYVAWAEYFSSSWGPPDILLRWSTDGGVTWDPPLSQEGRNLSNNAGYSMFPRLALVGSDLYVAWSDDTPGNYDIFFVAY